MSEEAPPVIVETPPEEKKKTRRAPKECKFVFESSPAESKADVTSALKADKAADAVKSMFELQPARQGSAVVSYGQVETATEQSTFESR